MSISLVVWTTTLGSFTFSSLFLHSQQIQSPSHCFLTILISFTWLWLWLPSLGVCFILTNVLTISTMTAILMCCYSSGSWSLSWLRLGMIVASFIDNLSYLTLHKRRLHFLLGETIWVRAFEVTPRVFASFNLLLPVFSPIVSIITSFVTRQGYIQLW